MKQALSVFLAFLMAIGCGLCAFAADPSVLHTATGIEAAWNGEILMDYNTYIPGEKVEPGFGYGNVAVTLTYADQEPKALEESDWYGYWNNDWRYDVCYAITDRTDAELTVTFYYNDTNLENAYRESGGELDWEVLKQLVWYNRHVPDLADYAATLPQTTIQVPANLMERYIESQQPLTKLEPKQAVTVPQRESGMGNYLIYSFTPKKSGPYYINLSDGVHDLFLLDSDCNFIATHDFLVGYGLIIAGTTGIRCMIEELEAGKTYYLITRESYEPLQMIVVDGVRELSPALRVGHALAGGLVWSTMLRHNGTVYAVPLTGNLGQRLLTFGSRILFYPYFIFIMFPMALIMSIQGVG